MDSWRGLLYICYGYISISYVSGLTVNYTTDQVVSSHDYPQAYRPGYTKSWIWRSNTGIWGVKVLDLDLTWPDALTINDGTAAFLYHSLADLPKTRIDSHGSILNITFESGSAGPKGRGFKVDVRHGENTQDLNFKFQSNPTPQITEQNADLDLILPLLMTVAAIVLLLFVAILAWFVCQRRRRRQQQVSFSVNVQGRIRRDSGVRYTRKPSSQSLSEEPQTPRKVNVGRSNSNRSWVVRAEMSATSTTTQGRTPTNVGCNRNTQVAPTQNVYTPMETVANDGKERVNQALPFRSRVPTLDRVPEDKLMSVIPVSADNSLKDDGYFGPSPSSDVSYLNCPTSSKTSECSGGYQNITVTGRVDIC